MRFCKIARRLWALIHDYANLQILLLFCTVIMMKGKATASKLFCEFQIVSNFEAGNAYLSGLGKYKFLFQLDKIFK
jgi:hypothetical protein